MTDPTPVRPTRRIVASLGGLFVAFAAFWLLVIVLSPLPDPGATVFAAVIMVAIPLALGIWLLYVGAPVMRTRAYWSEASRRIRGAHGFTRANLVASPLRRAGLGLVIAGVGFALAPPGARSFGIFVAFLAYSFADPAINAFRPRWWINTGKSLIGFIALFVAAATIGEVDKIGEAGMIFVGPLMVYPFALGISGLIRLIWFWLPPA